MDFGSLPSAAGMRLIAALVVMIGAVLVGVSMLGSRIVKPVDKLAEFSEKFAAGDYRAKAEIDSADDFGFIAEKAARSRSSWRSHFSRMQES